MKRYRVMIAEGSEDFRDALQKELNTCCQVCSCGSGQRFLELLAEYHPDLLVLDLQLPGMDGLSLLQCVEATGQCPGILVSSSYVSPYILEQLGKLGVDRVLQRPCSLGRMCGSVRDLLRDRQAGADRYSRISGALLELGFSSKLRGYAYLREAVLGVADHPDFQRVRDVYAKVGSSYGVSPEDVEHSIRSAAAEAWAHRGKGSWELYFPMQQGCRPSNLEILQGLSDSLRGMKELKKTP